MSNPSSFNTNKFGAPLTPFPGAPPTAPTSTTGSSMGHAPASPATVPNTSSYSNNTNWTSQYDQARSAFEQSRQKIGTKANDIYSIYQAAASSPLTAQQSTQVHDDLKAMAQESMNNHRLAQALTMQANKDKNLNELNDAGTEILGENATIQNATQQVHDLQAHNGLDQADGGKSYDLESQELEQHADQLIALADENNQAADYRTPDGVLDTTVQQTNPWHTDVSANELNSPGSTPMYDGSTDILGSDGSAVDNPRPTGLPGANRLTHPNARETIDGRVVNHGGA